MKRIDIDAILADPVMRKRLEEAFERSIKSVPPDETYVVDPRAKLAEMQAARRRGLARWAGVSAKDRSRQMKALRRKGGGMPRSTKPRCFCGRYTIDTATTRRFDCCKRAGLYPARHA